jgi:hypothetical protein
MVLWLKNQVCGLDLCHGPNGSVSRAVGWRPLHWKKARCQSQAAAASTTSLTVYVIHLKWYVSNWNYLLRKCHYKHAVNLVKLKSILSIFADKWLKEIQAWNAGTINRSPQKLRNITPGMTKPSWTQVSQKGKKFPRPGYFHLHIHCECPRPYTGAAVPS